MRSITVGAVIAGSMLWAGCASAATVTIGDNVNGGGITTVASGSGAASFFFSNASGTIEITGTTSAPSNPLNAGNTLDVSNVGGKGTLVIYVTVSGITSPLGSALGFLSAFESQLLPAGWTLTESTYLDPSDGIFTMTDPLSTETFTAPITAATGSNLVVSANTGTNPGGYSLTDVFSLAYDGTGTTQDQITVSATPLPAALPLFIGGLGLIGLVSRRRKRQASGALA